MFDFISSGAFSYITAGNSVCDHSSKTPCPVLLLGHLTRPSESVSTGGRQVGTGPGQEEEGLGSGLWAMGAPQKGVLWLWSG